MRLHPKVLIHVGLNEEQVTNYTYKNIAVQMYENHVLFEKLEVKALRNITAFDYYWRLYRNFNIRSQTEVEPYYKGSIDIVLQKIISFQTTIPSQILKVGFCSKIMMFINYCWLRIMGFL